MDKEIRKSLSFAVCGCGTVDSGVAFDTKGHWFESSHWQRLLIKRLQSTVCREDVNKEKEFVNGSFCSRTDRVFINSREN